MYAWKIKLEQAVINDDAETVEDLLKRRRLAVTLKSVLPFVRWEDQETDNLLHLAAYSNSVRTARLLIERGEDVNHPNEVGNTPLHIAALYNSWETADLLISMGAGVYIRNGADQTPLDVAVENGNEKIAELLKLTEKTKRTEAPARWSD